MARARILVVEDHDPLRRAYTRVLDSAGFETVPASDGWTALEAAGRERFDCILLDKHLPGACGYDVIEQLRATPATSTVPIILVTGDDDQSDRVNGLGAGADDYLFKPVDLHELVARVKAHCRSSARWTEQLDAHAAERASVIRALQAVEPGPTAAQTAFAFCARLVGLGGVIGASIDSWGETGLHPLAAVGAATPPPCAADLARRLRTGPWVIRLTDNDGGPDRRGGRYAVYVPMEHESHPVALASFVMDDTRLGGSASVALAMALDVSAGLHAIIDPELRTADRRAHIQHVLDNAAFATWYQPIVRLSDRAVVGFEALTRFDDESQPDLTFAEATAVGFGVDLQLAAVRSAVAGSRDLPPGWLSINVSAGALTERIDELRLLFRNLESRPVVIELTEHEAVGDYRLVLAALASLGPTVQVAVDDAGAGYAGLTHILSLQPQMVKLDRTVISGIDSDSARQAIVAGLHHFANETGCLLIAEGVERAEEARQLTALGVDLGQGFLFGRPAPIVRDDNAAA